MARTSTISIVIPTFRRPEGVDRLLRSLGRMRTDHCHFESVVVVDDSPDDLTKDVVERSVDALTNTTLVYVHNRSKGGPGKARNVGVARCNSDYVAFTDDDCVAHEDWIDKLVTSFDACPANIAAINGFKTTLHVSGPVTSYLKAGCLDKWKRSLDTANCAIRTDAFRAIGGFDENRTTICLEDTGLTIKFILRGYRIGYSPGATIFHDWKEDLMDQRIHSRAYGRGERDLYERYFRQLSSKEEIYNLLDAGYNIRNPTVTSRNVVGGAVNLAYATRSWLRNGVPPGKIPMNMLIWIVLAYERREGWKEGGEP